MGLSRAQRVARAVVAWMVVLVFVFPIFWWGLTSIKPFQAIFSAEPIFFDFAPVTTSYEVVLLGRSRESVELAQTGMIGGRSGGGGYYSVPALRDSIIIAVGSTALTIALSTIAAYALSRLRFRGQHHFVFFILSTRMLPPVAVAIPLFLLYRGIGLYDTYLGVILAHTLMNLPIATLLLKSFFDDIPREVDEAALVDGAGRFASFRRVALPMVRGGVAAAAVLCFVFSWTEFLLALSLTQTGVNTVPVASSSFVTSTGTEWGFISALGTAATIPAFVFIVLVQRNLVRGLTLGTLKG